MRAVVFAALILLGCPLAAQVVTDANRHMGVATCSASNCHGKAAKSTTARVWLTEYRIWRSQDYHARAFKTLASPESRLIAQKLGLKNAQSDPLCLDCHASNVSQSKRGPKFQLTDGVGCESCHGGAERWLDSHDNEGTSQADNIRNGMYPAADPTARADLCLTCHMGTANKMATHRIMGAGHPRLYFEVENFTINQPPHYEIDADYRQRKGDVPRVNLWLIGQFETAKRYLALLQSRQLAAGGLFPELAFYDCQGCHHPVETNPKAGDLRWTLARRAQGLVAGQPRLQDQHFQMLGAVAEVLAPGESPILSGKVSALLRAGQSNRDQITRAAADLGAWLEARRQSWTKRVITNEQARAIRRRLVRDAGTGRIQDYAIAELGLISVQTLTIYLGEENKLQGELDRLYQGLGGSASFRPGTYAAAARGVEGRF